MTPYAAQIPNIPIPTSFAELWLQLGWVLVIALFVIVFLLFQLARISLSSRAKKSEHTAAIATVEAKNAGIVADLAIQAMKFRDELDTLKQVREQESIEFRKEIERRDHDSAERDKEIARLKQAIDTLKSDHKREVDRLLGELKKAYEERDVQLKRANDLAIELDDLKKRVATLELPHTGDTDKLDAAKVPASDPAAANDVNGSAAA